VHDGKFATRANAGLRKFGFGIGGMPNLTASFNHKGDMYLKISNANNNTCNNP